MAHIDEPCPDLPAVWSRFDNPTIGGIHRENIPIRRDREAERHLEPAPLSHRGSIPRTRRAITRVGYRCDSTIERVRYEKRTVGGKAQPGRTDNQRSRVGPLIERARNRGKRRNARYHARRGQNNAHNTAF